MIQMTLLDRFRFTATLLSGGGRDERGNVLPKTETEIPGCLLTPKPRGEMDNFSENSETEADLHINHTVVIPKNAQIRTPIGSPIAGTWDVDGDAINWPLGTEVRLKKVGNHG